MKSLRHGLCAGLLLIVVLPVGLARAGEATLHYGFPHPDQTGVAGSLAPGVVGCGGGIGGACVAPGAAVLRIAPSGQVPRGRQGMLAFAAPAGTIVVGGQVRLRLRTKTGGVNVRILQHAGSRWIETRRVRSQAAAARMVPLGSGGTGVAVALTAEAAIPARPARAAGDNQVVVDAVELRVRDVHPPTAGWSDAGGFGGWSWRTGTVCGRLSGSDVGLGVDRLVLRVGDATTEAVAPEGSRLQPRPTHFTADLCVDTRSLDDGVYGTTAYAVDAGDGGSPSARLHGTLRIDNTAPQVDVRLPDDPEERRPTVRLRAYDRASGLADVKVLLDGVPLAVETDGPDLRARPLRDLVDGVYRLQWVARDHAGNVAEGWDTLEVADRTGPVVERLGPFGIAQGLEPVHFRVVDAGSGLVPDGVRIAVDGVDMTALLDVDGPDHRLRPVRPWDSGVHEVRVVAVDRSGNRTVATWTFDGPLPPPPAPEAPVVPADPPEPGAAPDAGADDGSIGAGARTGVRLSVPSRVVLPGGRGNIRIEARRGGRPAVGLRLRVRWQGGATLPSVVVDEAGVAVIRLAVTRPRVLEIDGGGAAADIRVAPGAQIRWQRGARAVRAGGAVVLRGTILPGRSARGSLEAFAGGRWQEALPVRVDARGRFSVRAVLPQRGRYLVRVRVGDLVSDPLRLQGR